MSLCARFLLSCSLLAAFAALSQPSPLPLRNSRPVVVAQYARMAAVPVEQRKQIYELLPVTMQGDLWAFHLETFLSDHPELNADQRAVFFEALGVIQSGALTPDASLQHLELRARAALKPDLIDLAFLELGPPDSFTANAKLIARPDADCECSTVSDYCCFLDCPTSPTPKCARGRRICSLVPTGCGFLWQYGCNGVCGG